MHLGAAQFWPVSNHRKQGWKGPQEDSQPVSFKARLALVKPLQPSASFRLQSHNTEGQGRWTKFYVSLWFLFILKTPAGPVVLLELLDIADSGRIAETSMTFPFPSGDWRLLPDSSECYLGCNTLIRASTAQLAFLLLGLRGGWGYATECDLRDHKSSPEVFNFYCPPGEVNYYLHLITKCCASVFVYIYAPGWLLST